MTERLQKIISAAGICSRRAAEGFISEGRVAVNGETAVLGKSADPERDLITLDGAPLRPKAEKTYIMLNKPKGYVTTLSDEKGRKTVAALVAGAGTRLFPVGRLDINSEGLLLMTDDGDAALKLTHPSHKVEKTYRVWTDCENPEKGAALLRAIRELDGESVASAEVRLAERTRSGAVFDITIHEGKNRQVRRMCQKAGMAVARLVRVSEGRLRLGDLPPGGWRRLTQAEVRYLQDIL